MHLSGILLCASYSFLTWQHYYCETFIINICNTWNSHLYQISWLLNLCNECQVNVSPTCLWICSVGMPIEGTYKNCTVKIWGKKMSEVQEICHR